MCRGTQRRQEQRDYIISIYIYTENLMKPTDLGFILNIAKSPLPVFSAVMQDSGAVWEEQRQLCQDSRVFCAKLLHTVNICPGCRRPELHLWWSLRWTYLERSRGAVDHRSFYLKHTKNFILKGVICLHFYSHLCTGNMFRLYQQLESSIWKESLDKQIFTGQLNTCIVCKLQNWSFSIQQANG